MSYGRSVLRLSRVSAILHLVLFICRARAHAALIRRESFMRTRLVAINEQTQRHVAMRQSYRISIGYPNGQPSSS